MNSPDYHEKVQIGGNVSKNTMSNKTNFAEKAPNLPFTEYDFYELYRETFEQSELGRIKRLLPLHELAASCGLVSGSLRPKRGRRSYFTPEGKVALMFLKMYRQQKNHFRSGDARESIPDRIVSISKPYVRPIVRGKEARNVEFGTKSNNILVDGLSFIKKLSFNAFSEGTRLKHCITLHKRLFGVDVKKIGGDTGYAGTDNRDHCKVHAIQTSFAKRGRPSAEKKERDFVRAELARVRATTMEGSFGTQKEHYALKRVKARKKATEILYIFFGIHTANVVNLAGRQFATG